MPKILMLNNDRELGAAALRIAPDWEIEYANAVPRGSERGDSDVVVLAGFGKLTDIITRSPNLKWVQTWSAGVDTVPLDLLKQRGVYLTNASGVHAYPISETIFALLLSFARGVHIAERVQRTAKWDPVEFLRLREIRGVSMGILGAGKIGTETAKIAKAFGMRVIGLVRNARDDENFDELTTDLNYVLEHTDCIVNILPLTKATHHIMSTAEFAKMNARSAYITVGRGPTTDFAALRTALEQNVIACAGIDVTEPEPLPDGDPLWSMSNVIIMPHVAGSTQYYNQRAGEIFLENLQALVATGKPIRNVVDLDAGY